MTNQEESGWKPGLSLSTGARRLGQWLGEGGEDLLTEPRTKPAPPVSTAVKTFPPRRSAGILNLPWRVEAALGSNVLGHDPVAGLWDDPVRLPPPNGLWCSAEGIGQIAERAELGRVASVAQRASHTS